MLLTKINKLTSIQASLIIASLGFIVFFSGLNNPFMGDDISQIVVNNPVHSITHIGSFFNEGTFYNGQGEKLTGVYYRPIMTTVFSLLYTMFGAHPVYFHILQMLLCIGSSIILYLFFRYSFKPALALSLSLIFLLHPINSQVMFAIPSIQDALFFFFGILAIWLLLRFNSVQSLFLVLLCLTLSLLAKETGILFVIMSLLYLFWFDRYRLYRFMGIIALPLALYFFLKIHAVGLNTNPNIAPIDNLSLQARLLTAPSILLFYVVKFVLPVQLASGYYWVHPTFSVSHFLLPLIIDLVLLGLVIYLAVIIRKKAPRPWFLSYLFFAAWTSLGLLSHLQIIPLDFTASETWFYFPMVGVLGMIGIVVAKLIPPLRIDRRIGLVLAGILIALFGLRTAIRGTEWRNANALALHDIAASKEDYVAYKSVAVYYYGKADYNNAERYAKRSASIFPTGNNENVLGTTYMALGDFPAAAQAFNDGLKHQNLPALYDNLASLTSVYSHPAADKQFLVSMINSHPQDANLWFYLAVLEYREGNIADAKYAFGQAYQYGPSSQAIAIDYERIVNGLAPTISFNPSPVPE